MCDDSVMDWGLLSDLIGAACAVLSIGGAGFAWWRANLSKKAKVEAEQARDLAERQTEATARTAHEVQATAGEVERVAEATKQTAAEVEKLADVAAGPPLTLRLARPNNSALWILRSARPYPLTIVDVLNRDKFSRFDIPELPFTLGAWQAAQVRAVMSWDLGEQLGLVLQVQEYDHVVHAVFER